MAGITHSAFRRLVASFGGYGALCTEMVPVSSLSSENMYASSLIKRRPEEKTVVYQLLISGNSSLEDAINKIKLIEPAALDVNLGCPAPMVSRKGGGKALFENIDRLKNTLTVIRELWDGPLLVKCRLGYQTPDWERHFIKRVNIFKETGVDALTLHPRFFHEKLKRCARWNYFSWVRKHWDGPLIGNGDMIDKQALELLDSRTCDGLMIGRAAIRKPWIFRELSGNEPEIDMKEVWNTLFEYVLEDFPEARALGKLKEFATYFSDNFFFGHELFRHCQSAASCSKLHKRVNEFLHSNPRLTQCH